MSEAARQAWTTEEFFRWQERQEERFELVGGFPLKMMTGATNVHDQIVVNIITGLRSRLGQNGFRVFTGSGSVETLPGQIRRPDVGVDCGAADPNGYKAAEPVLIVEVLSPSTRDFDSFGKLEEYKSVASVRHVLFVEPNTAMAVLWSRGEGSGWSRRNFEELEETVELSALQISLPLTEIYDGINLPPRPVLRQL